MTKYLRKRLVSIPVLAVALLTSVSVLAASQFTLIDMGDGLLVPVFLKNSGNNTSGGGSGGGGSGGGGGSTGGAASYDWGAAPPGITLPAWPVAPSASVATTVSNISQLNSALNAGNRAITLNANISSTVYINSDDNTINLNGYLIGGIVFDTSANRNRIFNGRINGQFDINGTDVLFDNVRVTPGQSNAVLGDLSRYAMLNSTVYTTGGMPTYISEYAQDIVIANVDLETTAGPSPGLRMMGPLRVVVVDSRIKGFDNAPFRVHGGDLPVARGAHDVWIARNQIEGNGGPGAFWFNIASGAPIGANITMSRMHVADNNLYYSNLQINSDEDPFYKYPDLVFYRNASYWTVTKDDNPWGAGGSAAYGYQFPKTGPNANIATNTVQPPYFGGGSTY